MRYVLRLYLAFLLAVLVGWLWWRSPAISTLSQDAHWSRLLGITGLYLCSHLLRMLRLTLLTLDERDKTFQLISAHTLTALPSSFVPFKLGEVLRLAAFFLVFKGRQKALAVWLAERFGDVLVITVFILGLYVFDVEVPPTMRTVFVLFVIISVIGLVSLFSLAKIFVYLNRHLVLTSLSPRGLILLRTSHALRRLEATIHRSVEGRLSGFLLLSVLIWSFEILALSFFINQFGIGEADIVVLLPSGLLASLSGDGGEMNGFMIYQPLALVVLTAVFLLVTWFAARLEFLKL